MARRTINFYTFDEADIIGVCPHDRGPLVRRLDLAGLFDLTEDESLNLEVGLWTIAFCPTGNKVMIFKSPLPTLEPDAVVPLEP